MKASDATSGLSAMDSFRGVISGDRYSGLPEGLERLDALREIDRFHTRLAVFIRRLGSEALV